LPGASLRGSRRGKTSGGAQHRAGGPIKP
jgi:hypothetical protein